MLDAEPWRVVWQPVKSLWGSGLPANFKSSRSKNSAFSNNLLHARVGHKLSEMGLIIAFLA